MNLLTKNKLNMSKKTLIIITTCPNSEEAIRLTEKIISNSLAACVNRFDNMSSSFLWKSKIHNEKESLLIIKTIDEKYQEIEALIKKMSSYELPEIIAIPIMKGSFEYLNWVEENVSIE